MSIIGLILLFAFLAASPASSQFFAPAGPNTILSTNSNSTGNNTLDVRCTLSRALTAMPVCLGSLRDVIEKWPLGTADVCCLRIGMNRCLSTAMNYGQCSGDEPVMRQSIRIVQSAANIIMGILSLQSCDYAEQETCNPIIGSILSSLRKLAKREAGTVSNISQESFRKEIVQVVCSYQNGSQRADMKQFCRENTTNALKSLLGDSSGPESSWNISRETEKTLDHPDWSNLNVSILEGILSERNESSTGNEGSSGIVEIVTANLELSSDSRENLTKSLEFSAGGSKENVSDSLESLRGSKENVSDSLESLRGSKENVSDSLESVRGSKENDIKNSSSELKTDLPSEEILNTSAEIQSNSTSTNHENSSLVSGRSLAVNFTKPYEFERTETNGSLTSPDFFNDTSSEHQTSDFNETSSAFNNRTIKTLRIVSEEGFNKNFIKRLNESYLDINTAKPLSTGNNATCCKLNSPIFFIRSVENGSLNNINNTRISRRRQGKQLEAKNDLNGSRSNSSFVGMEFTVTEIPINTSKNEPFRVMLLPVFGHSNKSRFNQSASPLPFIIDSTLIKHTTKNTNSSRKMKSPFNDMLDSIKVMTEEQTNNASKLFDHIFKSNASTTQRPPVLPEQIKGPSSSSFPAPAPQTISSPVLLPGDKHDSNLLKAIKIISNGATSSYRSGYVAVTFINYFLWKISCFLLY